MQVYSYSTSVPVICLSVVLPLYLQLIAYIEHNSSTFKPDVFPTITQEFIIPFISV